MKVCKFGGSSLANATQLSKVMDIVLADPARRIVVVSAPGKRFSGDTKVTDLLIALAKTALAGENTDRQFGAVVERYAEMADELKLGSEIVRNIEMDLMDRIAQVATLQPDEFMDLLKAAGEIASRFYIRFLVADKAGAFGTIATILGSHSVSISAASQKAGGVGNEPVPVVVLTHAAKAADLEAALKEIEASGVVGGAPVKLRMI